MMTSSMPTKNMFYAGNAPEALLWKTLCVRWAFGGAGCQGPSDLSRTPPLGIACSTQAARGGSEVSDSFSRHTLECLCRLAVRV